MLACFMLFDVLCDILGIMLLPSLKLYSNKCTPCVMKKIQNFEESTLVYYTVYQVLISGYSLHVHA